MPSYRVVMIVFGCLLVSLPGYGEPTAERASLVGIWIEKPRSPPGHIANVIEVTEKHRRLVGHWRIQGFSIGNVELNKFKLLGNSFSFEGLAQFRGEFIGGDEITIEHDPIEDPASHFAFTRASAADLATLDEDTPTGLMSRRRPLPDLHDVPSNGLALTPPMGWNSWNHFQSTIDDESIRGMADALVSSGLRDSGYVYLVLDDGWQGTRDKDGKLRPNVKFSDMKLLVDYVHSKGLKFGLYSSPGPLTCANYRGSHGYESKDANLFAQWGVDFLKYDLCSAELLYSRERDIRGLFQIMGDALQATGRPIVYSINSWRAEQPITSWGHAVGANLWRTSDDIADAWDVSTSNGFDNHGERAYVQAGGWNDPDMLEVGNGRMSIEEYRTHFTLWVMLAAPLFLGNDLRSMSPEIRDILTNHEVIAVDQDRLGEPGRPAWRRDGIEIWTKHLSERKMAVAVFNRGEASTKVRIDWAELGVSGIQQLRNLWTHADLRTSGGGYTVTVARHGCVLLSMSEAPRGKP